MYGHGKQLLARIAEVTAGGLIYIENLRIRSDPKGRLGGVVAVLLLAHLAMHLYRIAGHELLWTGIDLRQKLTIPNWYSSFALLVAAVLLLAVAGERRRARDRDAGCWYGLSAGFAAMSLDRIACIHQLLNASSSIAWEIPGAVIVAVIGIFYLGFLKRLPARTRRWFLASGAVYVFGVIVLEALENPYLLNIPVGTPADGFMALPDEGTQMVGVVMFIYALLAYMSAPHSPVADPRA